MEHISDVLMTFISGKWQSPK